MLGEPMETLRSGEAMETLSLVKRWRPRVWRNRGDPELGETIATLRVARPSVW